MRLHSDIIILELLKLYFEATDETKININTLKNGFYTLLSIIKRKHNIDINFNFEEELNRFIDTYYEYFNIDNNELEITEELKIVFKVIIDSHEKLSVVDYELQEDIFDSKLYKALNISISYNDVKGFFELNQRIIRLYLKLGENELHHYFDESIFEELTNEINELNERLNEADSRTLTKLKMFFEQYNDEFLAHSDETHINSVWNTILFSNNPKRLYSLTYDRIEYIVNMIDPDTDDESEETLNSFFDTENNNDEKLSEMSFFLTILMFKLEEYLKRNKNSIAREALIIKKYLLINAPELKHLEKYFLDNQTLDNYPEPPIPEDLDTNSFENLKKKVIECTTYLVVNNQELTKPHISAKVISACFFIKTFLDVSINPNSIEDIIDLITNSVFYKQPNYETITSIVDEIIFTDSPNLSR